MTKLAAVMFDKAIDKLGWSERAYIVNIVHDEINVECDIAISARVAKILKRSMENAGKVFVKKLPMTAVPKISEFLIK